MGPRIPVPRVLRPSTVPCHASCARPPGDTGTRDTVATRATRGTVVPLRAVACVVTGVPTSECPRAARRGLFSEDRDLSRSRDARTRGGPSTPRRARDA